MAIKTFALTTVQRAADYADLGTLTGLDNTIMERIIDSVTSFVESYTGVRFKKTTYSLEEYDTEDSETLNLKHFPVIESAAFTLSRRTSSLNEDDWETIESKYYHVDCDTGIIECAVGVVFSRTHKGYRVTYTAGYDFDNSATFLSDTIAGDVEMAVWFLCKTLWDRKKGSIDVQSESIGDYSVTYKKALMENDDIKAILDAYKDTETSGVITPFQA
jgi:hypothetical protein